MIEKLTPEILEAFKSIDYIQARVKLDRYSENWVTVKDVINYALKLQEEINVYKSIHEKSIREKTTSPSC